MTKMLRHARGESGQALPLALVALAIGALLVAPFLTHAGVSVIAARHDDQAIADGYATDAGIEWALWRLAANPALTSSATYTQLPVQPTPVAINDGAFPTTELRRVASAGATHSYDVRSQRNARAITARIKAAPGGVTVVSWQVD
ncbi:MAG: hypothetical protein WD379_09215 [Dehalococcoidia bacterium]